LPSQSAGLQRLKMYVQLTAQREREGNLPALRQMGEMLALGLLRGHGPGYYHAAGFWRRDVPWQVKLGHVSAEEYRRRVDALNPTPYRKISQHKLPEKALLTLCGVPTPRFLGFLHPQFGRDRNGDNLLDAVDLAQLLSREGTRRFCIKLVESFEGKGFNALEVHPDGLSGGVRRLGATGWLPLAEWCAANPPATDGYLVEEYVEQHPWYARLNPSSVNTFRVWVRRGPAGFTTTLAILKMGRAGSLVDNMSAGGIGASVDLGTGTLQPAFDGLPTRIRYDVHPDSGAAITAERPPMLADVLAIGERALEVFPHMDFAGIDVAVTAAGPLVIELNALPGRSEMDAGLPTDQALGAGCSVAEGRRER